MLARRASFLIPQRQPTVLISGASTGIGEDTAKLLAGNGWRVFAGVRNEKDAQKLRSHHRGITPVMLDVTKEDQILGTIKLIARAVGSNGLDVLINNAGVACPGPVETVPMEDLESRVDVNVFGMVRLTQATMPLIRMGMPGRVVNVGSLSSDRSRPYGGVECATKAAVETLSETLRRELAKWDIKVVLIKPGPVLTEHSRTVLSSLDSRANAEASETEPGNVYAKDMRHVSKMLEKTSKYSVSPRIVSDRIYHVISIENPRNIYYDTWGSYFSALFAKLFPVCCMDAMSAKLFFAKK